MSMPKRSTAEDSTTRRDKGTGALYQRASDGRWVAYVTLPAGPDGKPRRKVVTHRTRDGAQEKLRNMRRELDRAGDLTTSSPTVAVWMRAWLDQVAAKRLKPSTLPGYRSKIELYVIPTIGRKRMERLTPADVRRVHEYILDEKGLSPETALGAHRVLAKALTDAMREGVVTRNVATLVDAPRIRRGGGAALSADDARTLLKVTADQPTEALRWWLALLAGMRQGESLGITHDSVDLDRDIITVDWQLQRLQFEHGCRDEKGVVTCGRKRGGNCPARKLDVPPDHEVRHVTGGLYLTRPKSGAGWREVPMVGPLAEAMRLYLADAEPGMHGLIFHRPDGRPIDPSDDSKAWHAALERAGLPSVKLHNARHTTATLLHRLGVPDKVRMAIMGHSSATVTAGYTHIAGAEMTEALDRLGEHLRIEG